MVAAVEAVAVYGARYFYQQIEGEMKYNILDYFFSTFDSVFIP